MENEIENRRENKIFQHIQIALYIVVTLVLFLFSIDLMVSSFQRLGGNLSESILRATVNPYSALFIGLLITALLQSSSTTTAMTVALVASGSLTLQTSIPIIMGANIGTTITSTIVSLGFIHRKKEFRRAVAAGTYHDFFNILTAVVLFPLEYYYGFLSGLSTLLASSLFPNFDQPVNTTVDSYWLSFDPIINYLLRIFPNAGLLGLTGLVILFASIIIFRRIISDLLQVRAPAFVGRFFFRNPLKSFLWGLLTTSAIRSSTITTSVVVPFVAKRMVTLKQAAPFILGANIGTTITAFIAAGLNTSSSAALSIAMAHFLFNLIGVIIFFPIPILRNIPMELANRLGRLTLKFRMAGFVYLLSTFFFIPFVLIYFNQDSVESLELTYRRKAYSGPSHYRIITWFNRETLSGEWSQYEGEFPTADEPPSLIFPISGKNNSFFVGKEMFLFTRKGYCWETDSKDGKVEICVEDILDQFPIGGRTFDSVYVFQVRGEKDRDEASYYFSAPLKIMLKKISSDSSGVTVDELVSINRR